MPSKAGDKEKDKALMPSKAGDKESKLAILT